MPPEHSVSKGLRAAIIGQAKRFLTSLEAGASEEILTSILSDIKDKELQLIKEEQAMLDPQIWKILQNRFERRKSTDIIDTSDH
jgi:hypothetical protein